MPKPQELIRSLDKKLDTGDALLQHFSFLLSSCMGSCLSAPVGFFIGVLTTSLFSLKENNEYAKDILLGGATGGSAGAVIGIGAGTIGSDTTKAVLEGLIGQQAIRFFNILCKNPTQYSQTPKNFAQINFVANAIKFLLNKCAEEIIENKISDPKTQKLIKDLSKVVIHLLALKLAARHLGQESAAALMIVPLMRGIVKTLDALLSSDVTSNQSLQLN